MDATIRRKLSMAARALDFARANASTDPSHLAVVARLETRLARAEVLALQTRDGTMGEKSATTQRRELQQAMQRDMLGHLVRSVRAAERSHPGIAGDFRLTAANGSLREFVTNAKAMLAAGLPLQETLMEHGLGETVLGELANSLAAFEATTVDAHAARREHVGGRAELMAIARDCTELVGLLGGLVRLQFRGDAERLAAWESARNVVGPFKARADVVEPEAEVRALPPGTVQGS